MVDTLGAIRQKKDEPLRAYIKRFTNEVVHVIDANDQIKTYLLTQGLRQGNDFAKSITLKTPQNFNNLLEIAKDYIQYEEYLKANEAIFEWHEHENRL